MNVMTTSSSVSHSRPVLHCTWYAYNTVRVSYAYIRAEQFPGRIVRLRVLVLYCDVEIMVSGLLPLGIPARGWSCPPMLKGPIEHNPCTQIDSDKRGGPRLNDVHVLSRPLTYSSRIVRIIRVSYAYIRAFFLGTHV